MDDIESREDEEEEDKKMESAVSPDYRKRRLQRPRETPIDLQRSASREVEVDLLRRQSQSPKRRSPPPPLAGKDITVKAHSGNKAGPRKDTRDQGLKALQSFQVPRKIQKQP